MPEAGGRDASAGRPAPEHVVDASVVVAALAEGAISERAAAALPRALLSAVALAEVALLLAGRDLADANLAAVLDALECEVVPFRAEDARAAALLDARTGPVALGLTLGARAGLALAASRALPLLTVDPRWRTLDPALRVRVLR